MIVEHETEKYSWLYDSYYGVGYFLRKMDGHSTFLESGSDCQDVRRKFNRLKSKTSSPNYPKSAPSFSEMMDSIAGEYSYQLI